MYDKYTASPRGCFVRSAGRSFCPECRRARPDTERSRKHEREKSGFPQAVPYDDAKKAI